MHFCYPFKNVLLFLLPTQYDIENQEKVYVQVFNIVWRVSKSAKSANLSQDFCP